MSFISFKSPDSIQQGQVTLSCKEKTSRLKQKKTARMQNQWDLENNGWTEGKSKLQIQNQNHSSSGITESMRWEQIFDCWVVCLFGAFVSFESVKAILAYHSSLFNSPWPNISTAVQIFRPTNFCNRFFNFAIKRCTQISRKIYADNRWLLEPWHNFCRDNMNRSVLYFNLFNWIASAEQDFSCRGTISRFSYQINSFCRLLY